MNPQTVLLICDVWDNHYCKDLRRRTESLVERINEFAKVIREYGGRVLHCPSETVDTYYGDWPQRQAMRDYPAAAKTVSEEMQQIPIPLDTTLTTGCPDIPQCRTHCEYTRQHEGIEILPEDLISDSGQEVYNFLKHEKILRILVAGTALNMCVLGRPFGVKNLVSWRFGVDVVSDLVEVFYNPMEPPFVTIEQAKWLTLGHIQATLCTVTNTHKETVDLQRERNMKIHTNIPGPLLSRLRKQYRLNYFVETGTAYGDTAELAGMMFDRVWSCDIDARLVEKGIQRVTEYPHVKITKEPSPSFLAGLKPELTQPTLYWLDAHWCGGPTKPTKECPLLEELDAIGSFYTSFFQPTNGHSVIMIDDINLIENPPKPPHDPTQWPTMVQLRNTLDKWGEPYHFEWVEGDTSRILIVTPLGNRLPNT